MKLYRIEIKKLFGTFHYDINFKDASIPFILTGLNGYGKTTILSIIDSIAKKDLYYFYILPFESIDMYLEDGYRLSIISKYQMEEQQIGADCNTESARVVVFNLLGSDEYSKKVILDEEHINKAIYSLRYANKLERNNIMSENFYRAIKEDYDYYNTFLNEIDKNIGVLFMSLRPLETTFVEAQRILGEYPMDAESNRHSMFKEKHYVYKIQQITERIKGILERGRYRYLRKAQEIDANLIDQLLSGDAGLNSHEYAKLKGELDDKITELVNFNLLDTVYIRDYDENNAKILSVYIKNLERKLNVYDPLLEKLRLFSELLLSLDFINKKLSFSPRNGIRVQDPIGRNIDIKKLSSGEQNEIVMLYYMIFEVPDNKILLIDEPEISLHVRWQNCFLFNLSKIAEIKRLQVIVATHSPHIIGGRWMDCYDLCENLICDE